MVKPVVLRLSSLPKAVVARNAVDIGLQDTAASPACTASLTVPRLCGCVTVVDDECAVLA